MRQARGYPEIGVIERIDPLDREIQNARMGIAQAIQNLCKTVPFAPFEIKMVSGERYHVPHPEFAAVEGRGETVRVWQPGQRVRVVNSFLIEWVG